MKKELEYDRRMIKLIFHTAQDEIIDAERFWLTDEPDEEETKALIKTFDGCDYVEAYTFWAENTPDMVIDESSMRYVWKQVKS